jgi:pyruvate dehydrogenase E2 component (dihydrolipoamide acetyltransferase)
VRKLAKELGVDIAIVHGSGPEGRVVEGDVRRVAEKGAAFPEGTVAVSVSRGGLRPRRVEVSPIRASIAQALSGQARIPQVTTFRTVDCTALEAFRAGVGVSPIPVVIAALCAVVPGHPLINAAWGETEITTFGRVSVGIAVDTERGLMVPVLRAADERGIEEIADEMRRLAEGARAGVLSIEDHVGPATVAVSNTGSYGSEAGTPILSPGTSVTLAFGVIAPRALVVEGAVIARPAATISMTFDHRVLDGATAGRALSDLVALLESAERLGGLPR